MKDETTLEIDIMAKNILELWKQPDSIEKTIAMPKMVRQLYRALGEPEMDKFPIVKKRMYRPDKVSGYTKYINVKTPRQMRYYNNDSVDYHIDRPSETKRRIIDNYYKDGWNISVYAYNVICGRYEKHPDYENIGVYFYVSKDCAKYEYVIIDNEEEF